MPGGRGNSLIDRAVTAEFKLVLARFDGRMVCAACAIRRRCDSYSCGHVEFNTEYCRAAWYQRSVNTVREAFASQCARTSECASSHVRVCQRSIPRTSDNSSRLRDSFSAACFRRRGGDVVGASALIVASRLVAPGWTPAHYAGSRAAARAMATPSPRRQSSLNIRPFA